jgi:uncharacterized PurR-regulated membrane protein YhhQ (DUF165 family)
MTRKTLVITAAVAFLACIVAANYVTTEYGMVPVGFGLMATAGTYFAGLTFVLRDAVQDGIDRPAKRVAIWLWWRGNRRGPTQWGESRLVDYLKGATLMVLILAGALLSYLVSDPFIALASGVAFAVSETADLLIYSPLRERGYLRAATASNFVGAIVDTFLFLWIAGFPIAGAWQGQVVGKLMVTGAVIAVVPAVRSTRKVVTA